MSSSLLFSLRKCSPACECERQWCQWCIAGEPVMGECVLCACKATKSDTVQFVGPLNTTPIAVKIFLVRWLAPAAEKCDIRPNGETINIIPSSRNYYFNDIFSFHPCQNCNDNVRPVHNFHLIPISRGRWVNAFSSKTFLSIIFSIK